MRYHFIVTRVARFKRKTKKIASVSEDEAGPFALGAWSLSHRTLREAPFHSIGCICTFFTMSFDT